MNRSAEITTSQPLSQETVRSCRRINPRFLTLLAGAGISLLVIACTPITEPTPTIPSNAIFFLPREDNAPGVTSTAVPTRTMGPDYVISTPTGTPKVYSDSINVVPLPILTTPIPSEEGIARSIATAVALKARVASAEATYRALPSSTRAAVDTVTAQWAAQQTAIVAAKGTEISNKR